MQTRLSANQSARTILVILYKGYNTDKISLFSSLDGIQLLWIVQTDQGCD